MRISWAGTVRCLRSQCHEGEAVPSAPGSSRCCVMRAASGPRWSHPGLPLLFSESDLSRKLLSASSLECPGCVLEKGTAVSPTCILQRSQNSVNKTVYGGEQSLLQTHQLFLMIMTEELFLFLCWHRGISTTSLRWSITREPTHHKILDLRVVA